MLTYYIMNKSNSIWQSLPENSGVYIMLDKDKQVLYIGKAKNLKSRVRQYFHQYSQTEKTMVLVSKIKDINYIVTPSEYDALILENDLIKKHRPPYNILLKDDKTYPYIRINTKNDYPTIEITRKVKSDGARYFGPYMLGVSVRDIIDLIQSAFPIRTCRNTTFYRAQRECLNYHIGRCLAPCMGRVSKEEYNELVSRIIKFLSGDTQDIELSLKERMQKSAENQEFESALHYRDMLRRLETLARKQAIPFKIEVDIDVFGFVTNGLIAIINVSAVRGGKLLGSENYVLNDTTSENALSSFILQYYEKNPLLCTEILISEELEFQGEIAEHLARKENKRLNIFMPLSGIRKQLIDISINNARIYLEKRELYILRKEDLTTGAVEQLKEYLHLDKSPRRIECYDISNISGTDKVASMVVFYDGESEKSHYRHFRIKSVKGADDFASMKEALSRRFNRLVQQDGDPSFSQKPDLVVIDGGKGQLSSAIQGAEDNGIFDINIISLAKKEEEIFLPQQKDSVLLPKNSLALKLLVRIRDESHRFAITHHRKLRQNRQTLSALMAITGVGSQRAKNLILHYKDIDKIKNAKPEELATVKSISKTVAQNIYDYYHKR